MPGSSLEVGSFSFSLEMNYVDDRIILSELNDLCLLIYDDSHFKAGTQIIYYQAYITCQNIDLSDLLEYRLYG